MEPERTELASSREQAAPVPRLWLRHFPSTSLVAESGPKLSPDRHAGVVFETDPGTQPVGSVLAKADYDRPGVHQVAFVREL